MATSKVLAVAVLVGGAALPPVGDRLLTDPVAAQGAEQSEEFTALTYNVAGLPEQLSGSDPAVNTPLISPLLNDYDLVLVQESWINPDPPLPGIDFYHEILVSQVTHPYLSEPAVPPLGTDPRRPEALVADGLNRMSRFPFGDVTRVMWDNCFGGADPGDGGAADCLSLKGYSVARTSFAPGIDVDVYNLHAEAGSTPLDLQYRQEGMEQLAAHIVEHSDGRPVIVGGDFNIRRTRPSDAAAFDDLLETTGLVDVCDVVDCGTDDDVIDKFLFRSGGGVTIEALSHGFERERFRRDDGQPLSDHDALAVTFRWTGVVTDEAPAPGDGDEDDHHGGTDGGTGRPGPGLAPPAPAVRGTPDYTG